MEGEGREEKGKGGKGRGGEWRERGGKRREREEKGKGGKERGGRGEGEERERRGKRRERKGEGKGGKGRGGTVKKGSEGGSSKQIHTNLKYPRTNHLAFSLAVQYSHYQCI